MKMSTTKLSIFLLLILQEMWHDSRSEVTMTTDGSWNSISSFDYGIDIRDTDHVYFRLRCCTDAFVHLFPSYENPTDNALLSFGIISNAKCKIKPCSSCGERYTSDYPFLNCNELRPFWISWKNGILKLGQGHVVDQHLMVESTQLMGFTVQYMSVSSGWQAIGVWEIGGNYQISPSPCTELNFRLHDANSKVTNTVIHTSIQPTHINCVMECRLLRGCKSANYCSSNQICDIFNTVPLAGEMTPNSEWRLWISG